MTIASPDFGKLFDGERFDAPPIFVDDYVAHFSDYAGRDTIQPIFLGGDAMAVLRVLPSDSIDCCMTSPPYWNKREYESGGIGREADFQEFIEKLLQITREIGRVLKPTGSFWLNLGDSYQQKRLLGIPWRTAIRMCDQQGWILRNEVIWNKIKGAPDNSSDKLRNIHEPIFHFVRSSSYYFDSDAIRSTPKKAKIVNGSVVSATGVSGVRYRRQIELSTDLSDEEKSRAMGELKKLLGDVEHGKLADFRMVIRRQQRATHSNSESLSGRAKELRDCGFYFLKYHPGGSKPSDVWDVIPEDTHNRTDHFAPYPADLCRIPLAATCPHGGVVLDPFCGTGTTNIVAYELGRKSVGIDISVEYLRNAYRRCNSI